jgi:hypothetical protein
MDIKESTVTIVMWVFTIVIAIGIALQLAKLYGSTSTRHAINEKAPIWMIIIGFVGSVFVGAVSGKKREGFKALFSFK